MNRIYCISVLLSLLFTPGISTILYNYAYRGPGLCSSAALPNADISNGVINPTLTYDNIRFYGATMSVCRTMCNAISACIGYAAYPYNPNLASATLSDCWIFGLSGTVNSFSSSPGYLSNYTVGLTNTQNSQSGTIWTQTTVVAATTIPACAAKTASEDVADIVYLYMGNGLIFLPASGTTVENWYSKFSIDAEINDWGRNTCESMCNEYKAACVAYVLYRTNSILDNRICYIYSTTNAQVTNFAAQPLMTSRFYNIFAAPTANYPSPSTSFRKFKNTSLSDANYYDLYVKTSSMTTPESLSYIYTPRGMGLCSPVFYNDSTISSTFPFTYFANVEWSTCQIYCDAIAGCIGLGGYPSTGVTLGCWLFGGDFTGHAGLSGATPSSVSVNTGTGTTFVTNSFTGIGTRPNCAQKTATRPTYTYFIQSFTSLWWGASAITTYKIPTLPNNALAACRRLCMNMYECNAFTAWTTATVGLFPCWLYPFSGTNLSTNNVWASSFITPPDDSTVVFSYPNWNPDGLTAATGVTTEIKYRFS